MYSTVPYFERYKEERIYVSGNTLALWEFYLY